MLKAETQKQRMISQFLRREKHFKFLMEEIFADRWARTHDLLIHMQVGGRKRGGGVGVKGRVDHTGLRQSAWQEVLQTQILVAGSRTQPHKAYIHPYNSVPWLGFVNTITQS